MLINAHCLLDPLAIITPSTHCSSQFKTMSSGDTCSDAEHHLDKGKARAAPLECTEETPLLASASASYAADPTFPLQSHPRRRDALLSRLLSIFLFSLSLCIIAFSLVALIVYSYASRSTSLSPQELVQRALVFQGPDRLDVLNITSNGDIWVRIDGKVGLDAGAALGVNTEDGDSILGDLWKSIGRWSVHRLERISMNTTVIHISSTDGDILANVSVPTLELPLSANPPPDDTWLTSVSIPVLLQPTKDTWKLLSFARTCWRDGTVTVSASVAEVVVGGGGITETGWRKLVRIIRSDISSIIRIKSE